MTPNKQETSHSPERLAWPIPIRRSIERRESLFEISHRPFCLSAIPVHQSPQGAANLMIKNGLYKITTEMLDGAGISNVQIIILHDGKLHGGGPFFIPLAATPAPTESGKVKRLPKSIRLFSAKIRGRERWSPWDLGEPITMRMQKL